MACSETLLRTVSIDAIVRCSADAEIDVEKATRKATAQRLATTRVISTSMRVSPASERRGLSGGIDDADSDLERISGKGFMAK